MNREAYQCMIDTRSIMLIEYPFFGCILMHLKFVEAPWIETMATDGTHLLYNPEFAIELGEQFRMGVVGHEAYHCIYKHHVRMGDRDLKGWNIAGDYYINFDMKKMKFKLPDWMLYDDRFAGMSTEEIYDIVHKEPPPQKGGGGQQPQQGGQPGQQPGQSPGQGGQQPSGGKGKQQGKDDGGQPHPEAPDPGRMGGVIPPIPQWDSNGLAQEEARWEQITRQAVGVAMAQGAGEIPDFLKRVVSELEKSRVDWKTVFRNFVDDSMLFTYSWNRPNRRHMWRGIPLPARVSDGMHHLVVLADTSGSVNQKITNMYAGECTAILDEELVDKITVIYTDTVVQNVQEFERGDVVKLDPRGGGGTNFRKAFEYVVDNCGDASCIVFFTDADAIHYGNDPGIPVLWTVYGTTAQYERNSKRIPFGTAMHINP